MQSMNEGKGDYSKLLLALRQMQGSVTLKSEVLKKLEASGLLLFEDPDEIKTARVAFEGLRPVT